MGDTKAAIRNFFLDYSTALLCDGLTFIIKDVLLSGIRVIDAVELKVEAFPGIFGIWYSDNSGLAGCFSTGTGCSYHHIFVVFRLQKRANPGDNTYRHGGEKYGMMSLRIRGLRQLRFSVNLKNPIAVA